VKGKKGDDKPTTLIPEKLFLSLHSPVNSAPSSKTESFAHFFFQDQLDLEEIRRFLTRSGVTIGDSRDKIHHVILILSGVHHD
jgi:hypothetical protein